MLIVGCSNGTHIAPQIAKAAKKPYVKLFVDTFPDGETYLRFPKSVRGQTVVLVQSFFGHVNDSFIEVLFAADAARDLGAKKVYLVASYAPYFRQDKRFHPGEAVSNKSMAQLISSRFDKFIVVDPHLHRVTSLSELFSILKRKVTSNGVIADYIKRKYKKPLIVGPDSESYQWARRIANHIGADVMILKKKRFTGRKVKVMMPTKENLTGREVVFVDDIVSTGHTVIEAAKHLKKMGVKKFSCVAVHGVFREGAIDKLKKAKIDVVCTNTIPTAVSKIDVSKEIANVLK